MAHTVIMPRQGNTVESCIITDWKVNEGDNVSAETIICEVETDKAAFEVPAGASGTVLKILHEAGDDVPVLQAIAVIGAAGETISQETPRKGAEIPRESSRKDAEALRNKEGYEEDKETFSLSSSFPSSLSAPAPLRELNTYKAISPRARNLAIKDALPYEAVPGTGPGGRIIERDIKAALETRPALTAAAKAAVGIAPEFGSGIGGRVTTADMTANPPITKPQSSHSSFTDSPIKGIRKIISDRMTASLAESAQFTLNASASVSRLQDLRSRMKDSAYFPAESGLSKITINDMILFAVSRILPRFLYMNAHRIGDTIRTFEQVHLGFAADTPKGLMVPVIRNAHLLSLGQISSEAKRLANACQNGSIKPDELSGSTFTVSNLGSLGITGFTPILNTPEAAILGVCAIEMKPVSPEKCNCMCGMKLEPHIGFSLTINHQIVDGAPAARFLKALCEAVANIDILLMGGAHV